MVALRGERGFTLVELLVVIVIIGVLSAIGFALYVDVTRRGRIARAQADVRTVASAIAVYSGHMGRIPTIVEGLAVLAAPATNIQGQAAGPFLNRVPPPPSGGVPPWPGAYTYQPDVAPGGVASTGRFVVCASGDGVIAHSAFGTASCP